MNKNKLKTNNALSYRVDLKMEGFKCWNWKLKKDDCNSSFNWDTQNILGIVEYLLHRNPVWIPV